LADQATGIHPVEEVVPARRFDIAVEADSWRELFAGGKERKR
jgi:hypothetical protein